MGSAITNSLALLFPPEKTTIQHTEFMCIDKKSRIISGVRIVSSL